MYSISAITIVRDTLRTHLPCPYDMAGGDKRDGSLWVFGDEPVAGAKYPLIEIKKLDNPSEPIDIGYNYMEYEQLFLNIYFYTKNGFKVNVDGTEYVNSSFVEYYLCKIKDTLKSQASNLHNNGVKGYKHMNTTTPEYDTNSQLYFGAVTIRVLYFNKVDLSTESIDEFSPIYFDATGTTRLEYNSSTGRLEVWVDGVKKFEF